MIKQHNCFNCEICKYNTTIKQNYDKHILTKKHINKISNTNDKVLYICKNCNREYGTNAGLWYHKKTCVVEPTKAEPIPAPAPTATIPALTKETMKEFFENNKDFFMNMMIDEFKNNCGMLENQVIPYNSSNELVKFDSNNLKNEVIHMKEEIKTVAKKAEKAEIANEITNRRIDRLERKLNFYTDNYCKDNINYDDFIENLQITNKFCKDFSEDFCDTIINLIKTSLKRLGLENSPVYYMFNTDEKVILRVKNDIWKTYYYDEMKMPGLIGEIINPLIDKLKTEIDKLSDEKIKKRNGYIQHYDMLDRPNQQKGILDYGLYEPVFLDSRKMKRLINKKQGSSIVSEKEEKEEEDEEDDDEEEEDEEEDEDDDDEEEENEEDE